MPTLRSATLSISIERPWEEVYAYAADPANMPQWAAGLGHGFERDGDEWVFRDPAGNPARVRFTALNPYGVLDHDVFPAGQAPVHVAMRVMPNGDGAEVTFLLIETPGMSNADYQRDAAAVMKDLQTLKAVL
jgi:uncharacterized protein YndB with AHSA1/START domain